jgi:hypothetical protein
MPITQAPWSAERRVQRISRSGHCAAIDTKMENTYRQAIKVFKVSAPMISKIDGRLGGVLIPALQVIKKKILL